MAATSVLPTAAAPIHHPAPILCGLLSFDFVDPDEVSPDPESFAGAEEAAADAEEAEEAKERDEAAEAEDDDDEMPAAEDIDEEGEVIVVMVIMDAMDEVVDI
jgi:hypothetical protein